MDKRFGFRTGVFRDSSVEQATGELQRLGYAAMELCLERPDVRPETLTKARCLELLSFFAARGMALASVSYHADAEPLERRRENQRLAVAIAGWLGAGLLIINGEKLTDRPPQWAEHVTRLRELCRLADEADVVIAVEPEPLLVVGSTQEMMEMIAEVGSPRLRVNLDIGHAAITDDDIGDTIRALGPNLVHLHLEDIKDKVHRHLYFGEGDIDFAAVRQALDDVGYAGPYVADLFAQDDPPQVVAARALSGMRRWFG